MNDGLLLEAAIETDISKYVPPDDKWETRAIILLRDFPSASAVVEAVARMHSIRKYDITEAEVQRQVSFYVEQAVRENSWPIPNSPYVMQALDFDMANSPAVFDALGYAYRAKSDNPITRKLDRYFDQKDAKQLEDAGEMRKMLALVWMLRYVGFPSLGDSLEKLFPLIQKYLRPLPRPDLDWRFGNWLENVKTYAVWFRFNELQKVYRKAIDALLAICDTPTADSLMEMKYTEEQRVRYIG